MTRASLLYSYNQLQRADAGLGAILTGIDFDGAYKGQMARGFIVANPLVDRFLGRDHRLEDRVLDLFREGPRERATQRMHEQIGGLESRFGPMTAGYHHLMFDEYHIQPSYFCGESQIANLFVDHHNPFWDSRIAQMACSIEDSALNYSEYVTDSRDSWKRIRLQSWLLMKQDPALARIPVRHNLPSAAAKGRIPDFVSHAWMNLTWRLHGKPPLSLTEDWKSWLNSTHGSWQDQLLGPEARIWSLCDPDSLPPRGGGNLSLRE